VIREGVGWAESSRERRRTGGFTQLPNRALASSLSYVWEGEMTSQPGQSEFSVAAVAHDGRMVVTIRGEIDVLTAPEIGIAIAAALRMHPYTLVLDLGAVTFMDSSGCRALVEARRESFKSAVDLELRDITEPCLRTLQLLDLDKLFSFTDGNG
jgi:anti-sigma B factor antagonist